MHVHRVPGPAGGRRGAARSRSRSARLPRSAAPPVPRRHARATRCRPAPRGPGGRAGGARGTAPAPGPPGARPYSVARPHAAARSGRHVPAAVPCCPALQPKGGRGQVPTAPARPARRPGRPPGAGPDAHLSAYRIRRRRRAAHRVGSGPHLGEQRRLGQLHLLLAPRTDPRLGRLGGARRICRHWVNDGLMAVFFFVVGLEIKRELVVGELRDRRAAVLPAMAALGGVRAAGRDLPAARRRRSGAARLGRSRWPPTSRSRSACSRCSAAASPAGAKLFLLTLAIVDDLIAIVVIAVFYSDHVSLGWLARRGRRAAGRGGDAPVRGRLPWAYVPRGRSSCGSRRWSPGCTRRSRACVLGLLTPARPVRAARCSPTSSTALHPVSAS